MYETLPYTYADGKEVYAHNACMKKKELLLKKGISNYEEVLQNGKQLIAQVLAHLSLLLF
jgi:hypothetical protein